MSSASGGTTLTDVLLRPLACGRRGQKYAVLWHGEVIVYASYDPEHDAARVLLARGITGTMRTVDEAGAVRMLLDIEKAAKLTVIEEDSRGLRVRALDALSGGWVEGWRRSQRQEASG